MCGICGFFTSSKARLSAEQAELALRRMTTALSHRGPDDAGFWMDPKAGLAFGHRRLSILDLSPAGHQPMISEDGRFVLVMNGEIYNFRELRQELRKIGQVFVGNSDTEVMLAAFTRHGIEPALRRFTGMFAFALWDRHKRVLVFGRDRLGEKPLYFSLANQRLLFASELKAFRALPNWQAEVDPKSVAMLLAHKCVPAPFSIYQNVRKLMPACYLTFSEADLEAARTPAPKSYWSLEGAFTEGQENPFQGSEMDARQELTHIITQSIGRQMVADVPVGAFLSGGIDSSLVVALMQAQGAKPVKTFSIGFELEAFDEAQHAKAVAAHLGTDHTEVYVRTPELCGIVPELPRIYDEPFSDTSQIPTVLLCRIARQQVTVSLSGDGGDELFGGYHHYQKTLLLWKYMRLVPVHLRRGFAALIGGVSTRCLERALTRNTRLNRLLERSCNLSQVVGAPGFAELCQSLRSQCRGSSEWLREAGTPSSVFTDQSAWKSISCPLRQMMYADSRSFLPDDILVKVDRAAMDVGLETRIPLLDHKIVEFAARLPVTLLKKDGVGKWVLRQLLYEHVPPVLVNRPKKGFEPPIAHWMAGPLRDWAEDLLSEFRLRDTGLFNVAGVRHKWAQQLAGIRNWSHPLWSVLMFQAWATDQKTIATASEQRDTRQSTIMTA
jgi:asparagine synthase (glutamine-hydrolysing)